MKHEYISTSLYQNSLQGTFAILMAVSIVNLLYFLRTKRPLYLYSFFSTMIATCFYFVFNVQRRASIPLRYLDWVMTTPLLLIELCILIGIENWTLIVPILILNLFVFVFGWFGETQRVPRPIGCFLAFIPFLILFFLLYRFGNASGFLPFFFVVWTLYGLTYLIPTERVRNFSYNILDVVSKGLFSLLIL